MKTIIKKNTKKKKIGTGICEIEIELGKTTKIDGSIDYQRSEAYAQKPIP